MEKNAKLTVLMPVHNEERTIKEIIDRVLKQQAVTKLIVLNDHSTDRSVEIIKRKAAKDNRVRLFNVKNQKGKGNAIRIGMALVKSGLILIQDADLEYFPEDYPLLLSKTAPGRAVYGSRILGRDVGHRYRLARYANIAMSAAFSIFFGQTVTDLYTCYKLFDRKMINPYRLKENGFLIEAEMTMQLVSKGYRIVEVPIRYKGRTFEEGKKIVAMDGIKGLLYILRHGFVYVLSPRTKRIS
jgi:glycosyltransferase involved in cell wall biosynthesis